MLLIENLTHQLTPNTQLSHYSPFSQPRIFNIPNSPSAHNEQKSSTPHVSLGPPHIQKSSTKQIQQPSSIQNSPQNIKSPSKHHPSNTTDDLLTAESNPEYPSTLNVPKVSSLSKDIQKTKISEYSQNSPSFEKKKSPIQSRYPIVIAKAIGRFLQREIEGKAEKTKLDQDTLSFIQNYISCFEEIVQPFGSCLSFKVIFFGYGKLTQAEKEHVDVGQFVKMPRMSDEITKRLEEAFHEFFKYPNFAKWLKNKYSGEEESKRWLMDEYANIQRNLTPHKQKIVNSSPKAQK
jgi:hypothetical protein